MSNEPNNTPQLDLTDDERLGLPSGSSWYIDVACPGRRNLWRKIVEEAGGVPPKREASPAAERGTRIHRARELGNVLDLEPDEMDSYNRGIEMEGQAVRQWIEDIGSSAKVEKFTEGERELRLWYHNPETLMPEASAQLDVHFIADLANVSPPSAFILDWKSGMAIAAGRAADSWQLKLAAVLVWRELGCCPIRVGYNKFDAFKPVVDTYDYDFKALNDADAEIWYRIRLTKPENAPRNPGLHCAFCPCRAACREAASFALLPGAEVRWNMARQAGKQDKAEINALIEQLTPEELGYVYRKRSTITHILDAVTARMRTLSDKALAELGYRATPGRLDRSIPGDKTLEAVAALASKGLSDEAIWQLLDVNLTRTAAKLRELLPDQLTSDEKAKAFANDLLGPFIIEKRGETIVREA